MRVYRAVEEFSKLNKAIVTSGIFDGVHKGHQKILSNLVETAKACGGESVVITFWPHPKKVLRPGVDDIKNLSTLEERIQLIEENKIDHLLIIPFTKEFSMLTSDQFVKNILINQIGTKKLVIGYDHKFGKNREGSFDYLKENAAQLGFEVEEISRQDIEEVGVSSTLIRKALTEGKVKEATSYLGRPYSICGIVVEGKKLGRQLGYPTANIKVQDAEKLIPKDGVYTVRVKHKHQTYGGMLSIGYNPTIDDSHKKTIEVNIFNFSDTIYAEEIEIEFIEYLRDEEKFSGLEALKAQLAKDREDSLRILGKL